MGLQAWHSLCLRQLQDRGIGQEREEWDIRALEDTHSTYLVQGGGSCWAMKTQLVRMVHMMSMLKSVAPALRKPREGYWQIHKGDPQRKPWEGLTRKQP